LIAFWINAKGDKSKQRLFPRISMHTLKSCPILIRNDNDNKYFESIVDQILTAKKANPQADTTALEAEIDHLVFELYGLTEEEIRLIEESVRGK